MDTDLAEIRAKIETEMAALRAAVEQRTAQIAALQAENEAAEERAKKLVAAQEAIEIALLHIAEAGPLETAAPAKRQGTGGRRGKNKEMLLLLIERAGITGVTAQVLVERARLQGTEIALPTIRGFLWNAVKAGLIKRRDNDRRYVWPSAAAPGVEERRPDAAE